MLTEDGLRSRSNGVGIDILRAQAHALNAELIAVPTSWSDYEAKFQHAVLQARSLGATTLVFGDLRGASHRSWNEAMCHIGRVEPHMPLWNEDPRHIIGELDRYGYEALITAVNSDVLGPEYLARRVDSQLAQKLTRLGLDPCGEDGEYHTVVSDAPLFGHPISISFSPATLHSSYWHAASHLA